jgi:hypothetical protein
MRRYKLTVVTAADGSATAYSPRISGEIHQISYVKTDYANGGTFTVTSEATGQNIWTESAVNASADRAPRQPAHSQVGAALLYAAGGTAQSTRIALGNDRVKIVIASGGATKTGAFHILVD